jgi:hypothetical protein
VSDQDLRTLLRLLDTMDDHFDRQISDQEFLRLAASATDSQSPSAPHDPALAAGFRALDALLTAAKDDQLPPEPVRQPALCPRGPGETPQAPPPEKACQGINDSGR